MKPFYKLTNTMRDYAWGDPLHIPNMLGIPSDGKSPAAELWMGAHPSAPSKVLLDNSESIGLDALISENPEKTLGANVSDIYGRLPFLYKLLAAGKSLSIQAHPDKSMAEKGFAEEESRGVPIDAPHRNYKDDNHKPEIIMALTPFTAMIGFRKPEIIGAVFTALEMDHHLVLSSELLDSLNRGDEAMLKDFLTGLLNAEGKGKQALIERAVTMTDDDASGLDDLQRKWIPRLAEQFPGDIGALAPLFLNVVEIGEGEALYQPARVLHAYLDGFGLELMANSDNVLRGGLTPKNIDVAELASVLIFSSTSPEVLEAEVEPGRALRRFRTPAKEFSLAVGSMAGAGNAGDPISGPSIVLCLEGSLVLEGLGESLELRKGESAFVPCLSADVRLHGAGKAAVAGVSD